MGAFDYKDLTTAESAELAVLTHQLGSYAVLAKAYGLPVGGMLEGIAGLIGPGTMAGGKISLGLPEGWTQTDAAALGLEDRVDMDGNLMLESPMTGFAYSGAQLRIMEERDASGALTRIAVCYLGTNSPMDLPDYLQLNSGEMAAAIEPVLAALRDYAVAHGLTAEDVLVTGYSLGGGYADIQARFADTLAGGWFADSLYVGHESPVIFDGGDGRVLNIGYENDVVHRATGDAADFWSALGQAGPLLSNPDRSFLSSMDNFVIFDGSYRFAWLTQAVDSILNIGGSWWAHVGGIFSDAVARVSQSAFYEFTQRDSVMVVSNLGADMRWNTWVEDKASPTSDHHGAPAFIVGTAFDDLLGGGRGNDWIDGGLGDDRLRAGSGFDRVEGGAGFHTLRIEADPGTVTAWRLADGSLAVMTGDVLTVAQGIEDIEFTHKGPLGLVDWTAAYSIMGDRLEDDRRSLFEWGDQDVALRRAAEGVAAADMLTGTAVFGHGGDDRLTGIAGADLLVGGTGRDVLAGQGGADRLYGAEHDDRLTGDSAGDRLNGGHGNDVFVFTAATGQIVVEDFNHAANEADRLVLAGADVDRLIAGAVQDGADAVLHWGALTVRLAGVAVGDLDRGDFLLA